MSIDTQSPLTGQTAALREERSLRGSGSSRSAIPEPERSALADLEMENSGLRRMVVELLEKNQLLRQQLRSGDGERT